MDDEHGSLRSGHFEPVSRRDLLKRGGGVAVGVAALAATGCSGSTTGSAVRRVGTIRLASVTTVQEGGLLPTLLASFEAQTKQRVQVHVGDDVYVQARAAKADVVFSHFGHKDAERFITDGLGQWPRFVLFNSIALIVPARDPAGVASVTDPVEAFRRIAATRSTFIVNSLPELVYLADILWEAAGRPSKTGWYADTGLEKDAAMRAASGSDGYSLWGVTPFLELQKKARLALQPVLYEDEMFHRIMVAVVVNPAKFPGANVAGGLDLQKFLLTPSTQALIRDFRYPGIGQPLFWPAGRNNAPDLLPQANGSNGSHGKGEKPGGGNGGTSGNGNRGGNGNGGG